MSDTVGVDGRLTLREAIEASNKNTPIGDAVAGSFEDVDTVRFDSSLAGRSVLLTNQLTLSDDVIIEWLDADPRASMQTTRAESLWLHRALKRS